MIRIGNGYDVHRLVDGRKLIIGGVDVPFEKGLLGHSDADVLIHAICDALLGAAGLGDIGRHFPDTDPRFKGVSSLKLLGEVARLLEEKGFRVNNIDSTVVAERPKLAPHIPAMIESIAAAVRCDTLAVNVKATTTEGLGFAGKGEGIAAYAVCSIARSAKALGAVVADQEVTMRSRCFTIAILMTALWLLSGQTVQAADDQRYLYQWKDDRGVVNLTDSLDKVPQKYRSQAKQLLQPGAGKEERSSEETRDRVQSQDLDAGTSQDQDEMKKAEWQQRMHEAKRRLADAEDRYHQIELQKKELASKWGSFGAALPTQEVLNEMNRLEGELVRAKLDADKARTEVEVTIPDEARRADIPPGWLREVQ